MQIKFCGITRLEDALAATEYGATMLGINCYPASKRYLAPADAAVLCQALRATFGEACPLLVGVFVNADAAHMQQVMAQIELDFAQLSGDEPPSVLNRLDGRGFKAIRPADTTQAAQNVAMFSRYFAPDVRMPSLLLDAYHQGEYGGTGKTASDAIARQVCGAVPRLMLAGGLTPENVAERVQRIQPWGVDVASGIEGDTAGVKDHGKMREFIVEALRNAPQDET